MKLLTVAMVVASLFLLSGATTSTRPAFQDCGSLLPADTKYSINIVAYWDTSTQPYEEDITVTLRDEVRSVVPFDIPAEARPFVACIQSALAIE